MALPLVVTMTCIKARTMEGGDDEHLLFEATADDELRPNGGAGIKMIVKDSSGQTGLFTEGNDYTFTINV